MPEIAPFRALRYSTRRLGQDLSNLIAPPYDVLDAADKADLLAQPTATSWPSICRTCRPKSAGPGRGLRRGGRAAQAAGREDGTLVLEAEPAIYVYHQEYEHAGRRYTRKKFFARMRLEPFGTGTVFPHERTFGGPKEDRLKLMQATRVPAVGRVRPVQRPGQRDQRPARPRRPRARRHRRRWRASRTACGWFVTRRWPRLSPHVLLDRPVYIADGHHRYGTALNYRERLTVNDGALPIDHPARFVLVGFCAMEDPGCVILPTHRVLSGFG